MIFALAIDVQFIDGLIGRLIDQFAAIPTIVGLLSLFAASVIMANTVALSTLGAPPPDRHPESHRAEIPARLASYVHRIQLDRPSERRSWVLA